MNQETIDSTNRPEQWMRAIWIFAVRVALVVLVIYLGWRSRAIVADVIISSILAFAMVGPVNRLCRLQWLPFFTRRAKRLIASLFVFFTLLFVVAWTLHVLVTPFQRELANLKMNKETMLAAAASAKTWYRSLPPDLRTFLERQNPAGMIPSPGEYVSKALVGTFAGISKIIDIILVPVLAFYFVLDGHDLRNEFLSVLPKSRRRESIKLLRECSGIMRTFIVAQIWLCVIAGVVVFIFLDAFGMPSPLILAVLAGVTRAIPIIGPVIAGIPIVLLALLQPHGLVLGVKVLILFSLMHLIESKLIMPKFIGHRIHLHAALVIIVLLIGYEFFGLLGMFMAAPVAAFVRVLVNYYVIRPRLLVEKSAAAAGETAKPSLLIKAN